MHGLATRTLGTHSPVWSLCSELMVFRGMLSDLNERFEERVWDFLGLKHIGSEEKRRQAGRRLRDFYLPGNQSISLDTLSGLIDVM